MIGASGKNQIIDSHMVGCLNCCRNRNSSIMGRFYNFENLRYDSLSRCEFFVCPKYFCCNRSQSLRLVIDSFVVK